MLNNKDNLTYIDYNSTGSVHSDSAGLPIQHVHSRFGDTLDLLHKCYS